MRECFDEGTLQGYFDGELSRESMERVASHLTSCLMCTEAVRELEGESALLAEAFEAEFALSVPTEQLRQRIDAAIAGQRVKSGATVVPVKRWAQSIADLFTFSPQRAFAYAGLVAVVILVAIIGASQLRRATTPNTPTVALNKDERPTTNATASVPASAVLRAATDTPPKPMFEPPIEQASYRPNRGASHRPAIESDHVKLLPGERSYIKTIAELDTTIKDQSNTRPMRPALQVEYQRNLEMVDRAIATTRTAVKKNPNDPDAAEFMYAAYQSKVDLLNQVADARLANRQH